MSKLVFYLKKKPKSSLEISLRSVAGRNALLYANEALKLASAQEKEAITFLTRLQQKKQSRWGFASLNTLPMDKIFLFGREVGDFLKLAGNCPLFLEEKPLRLFPFSRLPLVLKMIDDGESLFVSPFAESGENLIAIEEESLISLEGTPSFVSSGELYFLKDTLHHRWLHFAQKGERVLEGMQREDLLDTLEGMEGHPKFPKVYLEREEPREKTKEALQPLLRLNDERGIFANLSFLYPFGELHWQGEMATGKEKERDFEEEKRLIQELESGGYRRDLKEGAIFYCSADKISKGLSYLLKKGWQIYSNQRLPLRAQTGQKFQVLSGDDTLLVRGEIEFGTEKLSLSDVNGAVFGFVRLKDGMGILDPATLPQTLCQVVSEGEVSSAGVKLQVAQFGLLKGFAEKKETQFDAKSEKWKGALLDFEGLAQSPPSHQFQGTLRSYQQVGVNWLEFLHKYRFGGILADEMGLGKTVQVLAFLSRRLDEGPYLFVLPLSLIENWKRELAVFLPQASVFIHHGMDRAQQLEDFPQTGIVLTSYGILRQDESLLASVVFKGVFFDEAQMIKNPTTGAAKAAAALQGEFRLSLTGTPVENSEKDLQAHFGVLMPGLIKKKSGLEALKYKTAPFVLKRTKEEVLSDLPPIYEDTVYLSPNEVEKDWHAKIESNLKEASDGTAALSAILKMRQVCSHPSLVDASFKGENFTKLERVLSDLEVFAEEKKQVLVFTQFLGILDLLESRLGEIGISFARLDGGVKNREDVITSFQKGEITVLGMTPKVGGVGLNLTQADAVLLYDPWWNRAQERQAIGRAHRIGREHPVFVKRYLLLETIEEVMERIQEQKEHIGRQAIDGGELESLIARFISYDYEAV